MTENRIGSAERRMGIDPRMLELLVCPLTKGPLTLDPESNMLISAKARLAYPVRGGIPILLPSEARPLEDKPVPPVKSGKK